MEFAHQTQLITWAPQTGSEIIEESRIKYVCDLMSYRVLSSVKKQSLLGEWVQKRLRQGRMYIAEAYDKRKTSQWKVFKGVRDPSKKVDHNFFRHLNLKEKALLREVVRDSARGYTELY